MSISCLSTINSISRPEFAVGSTTTRRTDKTAHRSQKEIADRRSWWQWRLAITPLVGSDKAWGRTVVANCRVDQPVPLNRRDDLLLEMLYCHRRHVPELFEHLIRHCWVFVHYELPQHSVAQVQNLDETKICQNQNETKNHVSQLISILTFPGMKQQPQSVVKG